MSENPPNEPGYDGPPDPDRPDLNKKRNPADGGYPPPPGNYPPPPGNVPPQGNYPPPGGYPPPGNYPPPQGNYPPQGGYPPPGNYPPPQGNYAPQGGYPPPPGNYPPPPGSFGGQQFGGPGYGNQGVSALSVGDAISFGWNRFKDNAGIWVGVVLIAAVIQVVINLLFGGIGGSTSDLSATFGVLNIIGTIVTTVVGYLIQAAFVRGALHEVDGNKPAFGSFFQYSNVANIIVASLVVGIASAIGFFLLIIPGIVVVFLTWWTLQFVIDRNEEAIPAIKSSYRAISSNAGTLVLLVLALFGLNLVGLLLCGLGLLVTLPITFIASTYAYRVVTSGGARA